jgi:hypothetical protein
LITSIRATFKARETSAHCGINDFCLNGHHDQLQPEKSTQSQGKSSPEEKTAEEAPQEHASVPMHPVWTKPTAEIQKSLKPEKLDNRPCKRFVRMACANPKSA